MLGHWSRWQAPDVGVDGSYADHPEEFYDSELADAPGWKVGGWPRGAHRRHLRSIRTPTWSNEPSGFVHFEEQHLSMGLSSS
ncbi:hypothetical protein GCM10010433_06210 [Streptomyces pulveraceus]